VKEGKRNEKRNENANHCWKASIVRDNNAECFSNIDSVGKLIGARGFVESIVTFA
jgi:hypothetical protein